MLLTTSQIINLIQPIITIHKFDKAHGAKPKKAQVWRRRNPNHPVTTLFGAKPFQIRAKSPSGSLSTATPAPHDGKTKAEAAAAAERKP